MRTSLFMFMAVTCAGCSAQRAGGLDVPAGDGELGTSAQTLCTTILNPTQASEHTKVLNLVPDANVGYRIVSSGAWEDPTIWDVTGRPPLNSNPDVAINAGLDVTFSSIEPVALHTLRIDGNLHFDPLADTSLVVDTIVVNATGLLEIGTPDAPIDPAATATIAFSGASAINTAWDPYLFSRGLVSLGAVHISGNETTPFLAVTSGATAGSTSMTLASPPAGWAVGGSVALTGTNPNLTTDTEELTITGVSGSTVTFTPALSYDHLTPDPSLHPYLASLTRNVVFTSQNTSTAYRGHAVFMHLPDIEISGARFEHMGRTDKSTPIVDATVTGGVLVPGTGTNVRGRYAVHVHRADQADPCGTVVIRDSVVEDSPGWGFVNHSSNVTYSDNVSHKVFGAHFVTEAGDELGTFSHNIALKSTGQGGEIEARKADNDWGYEGHGFWFQGAGGLHITDNVAAGEVIGGFVVYPVGLTQTIGGVPVVTQFPTAFLADGAWAGNAPGVQVSLAPIPEFARNEVFHTPIGVYIYYMEESPPDPQQSIVQNLSTWNQQSYGAAVYLPYANRITIQDSVMRGLASAPVGTGLTGTNATGFIVLDNCQFENFGTGVALPMEGNNQVIGGDYHNVTNFSIPTFGEIGRVCEFGGGIVMGPPAVSNGQHWDIALNGDMGGNTWNFPQYFTEDQVLLDDPPHAGMQAYFAEQAPNFVPFPTGGPMTWVPSDLLDKTNAAIYAQYGMALYGAVTPAGAVNDPNIKADIASRATYSPVYQLYSAQQVSKSANYQLQYVSAPGVIYTDPVLTNLKIGWNLLTRTINGQLITFLVHNDGTGDPPPPPQPGCVTIRRGLLGTVADSWTRASVPTTNYGTSATTTAGVLSDGAREALFRFDMSSVPASSTITSAKVYLTATGNTGVAETINVNRILTPWVESTVTWNTLVNEVNPTPETSFSNGGPSHVGTLSFDITPLVTSWYNGSVANDGIVLESAGGPLANTFFDTSEFGTIASRPGLTVCYTTP